MAQLSELEIQQAIQTAIQATTGFSSADVTINDWSVLDGPIENAPYAVISDADDFVNRQDVQTPTASWDEVVQLYEYFTDWPTTLNNFRTHRQAIIDKFNSGSIRSAGGQGGIDITEIKNLGPIMPYYGPYIDPNQQPESLPQFIYQTLVVHCEEF